MVTRNRDITKRMNWFDRQFVRAQDLADEQDRNLDREHRHNKTLHTRGVADGLGVVKSTAAGEERMVLVEPGTAYDSKGRAIVLTVAPTETHRKLDLSAVGVTSGTTYATPLYVAIGYTEQEADSRTESGVTGSTRMHEQPRFDVSTSAPTDPDLLLLAVVSRNAATGQVTGVDTNPTGRRVAGAVLAPASVGSTQIADGSIQSRHIADPGVFTVDLAAGAVESRHVKLANGSTDVSAGTGIMTGHLRDGSVTEAKLANGAVKTDHIQNFQVTTDKLADAAVNQFKILPNAVTEFGLRGDNNDAQDAERAVTSRHIRNRNVTEAKLDDNSVGARQIIDGSVGTAEIADDAVTLGKLRAPVLFNGSITVPAGGIQLVTVLSIPGHGARGAILLVEAFSPNIGATFEWRERSVTGPFPPPFNFRILHVVVFQNLGGADIQVNAVIRELLKA